MGDGATLTNFLKWASARYSAKNIVLMLGDHGVGTEWEAVAGGADYKYSTRSLCVDVTNGTKLVLTATDVVNAISASGFKLNVLWMDCCLQGAAETAYFLRGIADYFCASANAVVPNEYYEICTGFTTSSTPETFSQSVVATYKKLRGQGNNQVDSMRTSFDTMITFASYSLNNDKQTALYNAVDSLANALLSESDSVVSGVYSSYIVQVPNDHSACKGMAFKGTYTYLNDIGYFCYNLINDPSSVGVSSATKTAAKSVMSALSDVIIASFGGKTGSGTYNFRTGMYSTQSEKIYYKKNLPSVTEDTMLSSEDGSFGLTIATQLGTDAYETKGYLPLYSDYAGVTGYSAKWGEVMKKWHGK